MELKPCGTKGWPSSWNVLPEMVRPPEAKAAGAGACATRHRQAINEIASAFLSLSRLARRGGGGGNGHWRRSETASCKDTGPQDPGPLHSLVLDILFPPQSLREDESQVLVPRLTGKQITT